LGDSAFRPVTSLEYVYEVLQCGRSHDGCEDLLWLRFPECLSQLLEHRWAIGSGRFVFVRPLEYLKKLSRLYAYRLGKISRCMKSLPFSILNESSNCGFQIRHGCVAILRHHSSLPASMCVLIPVVFFWLGTISLVHIGVCLRYLN